MQKITIKNFGPIKDAEIEIKKVLVLIGEQASGKSTIAKLIYFFKSIGDIFYNNLRKADRDNYDVTQDLKKPIREEFYKFFGSTKHLPNFEIVYHCSDSRSVALNLAEDKSLLVNFSSNFFDRNFQRKINQTKQELNEINKKLNSVKDFTEHVIYEQKISLLKKMWSLIGELFENKHNSSLFVVAGRESTVSYGTTFETSFQNTLSDKENSDVKRTFKKAQTTNEYLMVDFLKRVDDLKRDFFNNEGTFDGLIFRYSEDFPHPKLLEIFNFKIEKILKGKYKIDSWGEKLILENEQYVYFQNASSGQQESLRILQDLFISFLRQEKFFKVVEEPESHLFPEAQKELVELLMFTANQFSENQLIITTHSPYILTAINNLLFYSRICKRNSDAISEIQEHFGIQDLENQKINILPDEFQAYSINTTQKICKSIFDKESGLICENFLDEITEQLNEDFNFLYELNVS